jgi:hypothetical protein
VLVEVVDGGGAGAAQEQGAEGLVLRRRDDGLARAAGDLAWSEPEPAPSELAALVSRVGDEVGDR